MAANRVADRQHRVVTAGQARICGLGIKAVKGLVARGSWSRIRRGVYHVGLGEPSPQAEMLAAVAVCGPGAVTSHLTSAWLWGLTDHFPRALHVTVFGGRNPGQPAGVRVHRTTRSSGVYRWRSGIPLTSPVDTLVDLAALLDPRQLEAAVAMALRRHLVTRARLSEAVASAGGRKGIATLRALTTNAKLTRSQLERRVLALIRAAELPEPETNVVVEGKELDVYWPDSRLAIEVDTFSTHGDAASFEDDHVLDVDLEAASIKLLRFTGPRVRERPEAVVARIAAVMALRLGGLPAPPRRGR